jgi:hypothetical protein
MQTCLGDLGCGSYVLLLGSPRGCRAPRSPSLASLLEFFNGWRPPSFVFKLEWLQKWPNFWPSSWIGDGRWWFEVRGEETLAKAWVWWRNLEVDGEILHLLSSLKANRENLTQKHPPHTTLGLSQKEEPLPRNLGRPRRPIGPLGRRQWCLTARGFGQWVPSVLSPLIDVQFL